MAETPPSSRRLHTPPAPRHGPQEDEWTPFTPRRSSRVAAQRSRGPQTQTPLKGKLAASSSHTFSPPSSPISPSHNTSHRQSNSAKRSIPTPRRHKVRVPSPASSETEIEESHIASKPVLPTPVKTPRKKDLSRETINFNSRVLFHPRLANVDDAMPAPKKARRSKGLSMDPFDDLEPQADKIEVYEDSKERIPTADYDEDNPFLAQPGAQRSKPSSRPTRNRPKSGRDKKIEAAVQNEEGVSYVFRGKKIFRRFDDADNEEDDNLSDLDIRRRAGVAQSARFTRTSLKPRILFPTEEQLRAKEAAAAEEADEEAVTDIEVPWPSPHTKATAKASKPRATPGTAKSENHDTALAPDSSVNAEQSSIPLQTPTADGDQNAEIFTNDDPVNKEDDGTGTAEPVTNKRLHNPKRGRNSSPFDKWSRTKHLEIPATTTKVSKRQGSPLENQAKRVRSGSHTAPI